MSALLRWVTDTVRRRPSSDHRDEKEQTEENELQATANAIPPQFTLPPQEVPALALNVDMRIANVEDDDAEQLPSPPILNRNMWLESLTLQKKPSGRKHAKSSLAASRGSGASSSMTHVNRRTQALVADKRKSAPLHAVFLRRLQEASSRPVMVDNFEGETTEVDSVLLSRFVDALSVSSSSSDQGGPTVRFQDLPPTADMIREASNHVGASDEVVDEEEQEEDDEEELEEEEEEEDDTEHNVVESRGWLSSLHPAKLLKSVSLPKIVSDDLIAMSLLFRDKQRELAAVRGALPLTPENFSREDHFYALLSQHAYDYAHRLKHFDIASHTKVSCSSIGTFQLIPELCSACASVFHRVALPVAPVLPADQLPEVIVAFKGTELCKRDVTTDWQLALGGKIPDSFAAELWGLLGKVQERFPLNGTRVMLTGHSLGGASASYVCRHWTEQNYLQLTLHILGAVVFNVGQGLDPDYQSMWGRHTEIRSIRMVGDPISFFSGFDHPQGCILYVAADGNKEDLDPEFLWNYLSRYPMYCKNYHPLKHFLSVFAMRKTVVYEYDSGNTNCLPHT
jgi:hypothetical protein